MRSACEEASSLLKQSKFEEGVKKKKLQGILIKHSQNQEGVDAF